jgi:hypothetical protein
MLVSRDEQSCLIVSYREVSPVHCVREQRSDGGTGEELYRYCLPRPLSMIGVRLGFLVPVCDRIPIACNRLSYTSTLQRRANNWSLVRCTDSGRLERQVTHLHLLLSPPSSLGPCPATLPPRAPLGTIQPRTRPNGRRTHVHPSRVPPQAPFHHLQPIRSTSPTTSSRPSSPPSSPPPVRRPLPLSPRVRELMRARTAEYEAKESARQFLEGLAERVSPGAKLLPFGYVRVLCARERARG